MKKILYIILLVSVAFTGCKNSKVKSVNYAHGRSGHIIVVMSDERWNSESGDALRDVFHQYYEAVPMEEYIFTMHQLPKERFVEQNLYHKNIIFQEINPNVEKSAIKIVRNKYAQNQLFVNVVAKNQAEFAQLIEANKDKLINLFLEADRDRWLEQLSKYTNKTVSNNLLKNFDITINIPKNYYIDVIKDDFAWIANDTRKYSMNILVYTYPITDSTKLEVNYLISERNKMAKNNVPGANPGSYMSTETEFDFPLFEVTDINGETTGVMRGLWKVKGDFMGGPFVSYTKIDRPRNRIVTVEGFVYHPNEEVRDQIRQLEGVLYTFKLLK